MTVVAMIAKAAAIAFVVGVMAFGVGAAWINSGRIRRR